MALIGWTTGCADSAASDGELCAEATSHVQSCFPDQDVRSPDTCDPEQAERTLASSCDELAADEKADGYCNPWLWWSCGSNSGGGSSYGSTEDREIWVHVKVCSSVVCGTVSGAGPCGLVVLENEAGEEVARAHTGRHGGAHFEDLELEDGKYFAKLYERDGQLATAIFEKEYSFNRSIEKEAVVEFEVEDDEEHASIYLARGGEENLNRCASVRGTLASTCEGAPMDADTTEWAWFVKITGENADGEFVDYIRPFNHHDENRWFFPQVLPGEYEVTFLEMDVPSYKQRNNPDYERLVRSYDTGRAFNLDVSVGESDAGATLDQGNVELDHQDCR